MPKEVACGRLGAAKERDKTMAERIPVRNPNEIAKMRKAGEVSARILMDLMPIIRPGVTTKEIDDYAAELFKREKCDVVANLGDIADIFYPKGYAGYSETVEEIWPRSAADHPREIYVFAWHDYYGYKGDMNRSTPKWKEACAEAAALL